MTTVFSSPISTSDNLGGPTDVASRPVHRIQRKPPAFDLSLNSPLQKLASLPSAPSAILHLNLLRSESPRCPSSPELPSSPCTSDFRSSDGEEDSAFESDLDDDEHFRLGMPRLHSSLGKSNINFARPFPQLSTNVTSLDSDNEDKGDDESGPGGEELGGSRLILDPEAVQHLFGRSLQRTRRMTSTRDLASILNGTAPDPTASEEAPPPVPALPSTYSLSRTNSSVRSEHSSTSSTFTTFNNPRRVASRSAFRDELAELADTAAFPMPPSKSPTRMSKQRSRTTSDEEKDKPTKKAEAEPAQEGRRQGIDFGNALASPIRDNSSVSAKALESRPMIVDDSEEIVEDDARVVDRLLKGFRQGRKSANSPSGPTALPQRISRPGSPSPSRPDSVASNLVAASPTTPTFSTGTTYTPASAHALFASMPTLFPSASENGLAMSTNSSGVNPSISSPLRSSTSLTDSATTPPASAVPTTIIVGAYTTRKRAAPVAPSLGLKELRELRSAAVVLEQEAKRTLRTAFPTDQMEKRLKRKPVPGRVVLAEVNINGEVLEVLSDDASSLGQASLEGGPAPISSASSSSGETYFTPTPTPKGEEVDENEMAVDLDEELGDEEEMMTPKPALSPVDGMIQQQHVLSVDILPPSPTSASDSLFRRSTLNPVRKETQSPFFAPRTSSLVSTRDGPKIAPRTTSLLSIRPIRHRRRRSSASSSSSFESCPIPPTPEEASFFPPCPSPQPDEFGLLPSAQSLLFEQVLSAQAAVEGGGAASVGEWTAGARQSETRGAVEGLGLGLVEGSGPRAAKRQREVSAGSAKSGGGLKRWGEEARRVLSGGGASRRVGGQ